jgi:hypothetical protein
MISKDSDALVQIGGMYIILLLVEQCDNFDKTLGAGTVKLLNVLMQLRKVSQIYVFDISMFFSSSFVYHSYFLTMNLKKYIHFITLLIHLICFRA